MVAIVLARDVEIADIDGRHWDNWMRLLMPPGVTEDPVFAVAWVDDGALVKAVVRGRGAVPVDGLPYDGSADAPRALAEALGVKVAIVLDRGVLGELCARIENDLRLDDDYVAQGLTMLRACKPLAGTGIWTEPRLLELLPAPPYEALQRTFDFLIPDGSAMIAYVIEDDRSDVHASIVATKVDGEVDQVATHKAIEDLLPARTLARNWRAHHKLVLEAVEQRFAKPSVAVFLERRTYYRVLTGPTDTLAREIRARNLIIDPAPAWLLGLLGGATVAAVASRGARALSSLLPDQARQLASRLAREARAAAASSGANPWSLLGFDPIELWLSVRHLYRAPHGH